MKEVINGIEYQITPIAKNAMRISDVAAKECCLDRYGITKPASDATLPNYEVKGNTLILKNGNGEVLTAIEFSYKKGAWCVSFTLTEKEHLYGPETLRVTVSIREAISAICGSLTCSHISLSRILCQAAVGR